MKLGKKTDYKLLDTLWVKIKNDDKLILLPLVYDFSENKFLDVLNDIEYVSKQVKDRDANDDYINKYLIPLDIFDEISNMGEIENVFTAKELESMVNGPMGLIFNKDANIKNGKRGNFYTLIKNGTVTAKELRKMSKVYLTQLEKMGNSGAKVKDEIDLCE